jgi:hypothetical protein
MEVYEVYNGKLYLKDKAQKGILEEFRYDEISIKGIIVSYLLSRTTCDGYPNGHDSFKRDQLLTYKEAKEVAKIYLEKKLNELK